MAIDFIGIKEANRMVRAELDARDKRIADREVAALQELAACERERAELTAQRAALDEAEKLYQYVLPVGTTPATESCNKLVNLSLTDDTVTESAQLEAKQRRARVGPQRYLILAGLRLRGPMDIGSVVEATGLSFKRVKDQLRADFSDGIVAFEGEASGPHNTIFRLTAAGQNLLSRYEAYKGSRGEPLPSIIDAMFELGALEKAKAETGGEP